MAISRTDACREYGSRLRSLTSTSTSGDLNDILPVCISTGKSPQYIKLRTHFHILIITMPSPPLPRSALTTIYAIIRKANAIQTSSSCFNKPDTLYPIPGRTGSPTYKLFHQARNLSAASSAICRSNPSTIQANNITTTRMSRHPSAKRSSSSWS